MEPDELEIELLFHFLIRHDFSISHQQLRVPPLTTLLRVLSAAEADYRLLLWRLLKAVVKVLAYVPLRSQQGSWEAVWIPAVVDIIDQTNLVSTRK